MSGQYIGDTQEAETPPLIPAVHPPKQRQNQVTTLVIGVGVGFIMVGIILAVLWFSGAM